MKHRTTKILCLIMSVAIILAIVPNFSVDTFATNKGSESCSASSQDNVAKVSMSLYNASYASGDTATYIVDRYYYKTMTDYGNIYSTTFEGVGMFYSTNIVASGDFSISNTSKVDDALINAGGNTPGSTSAGGTLVGNVPEPGQRKTVNITSYVTVRWRIDAVSQFPVFSNSTSASLNAVVIGVDSTDLQNEIVRDSALASSCWTSETWTPFAAALANAKSVAKSTTALQPEIDSAAEALVEARQNLVHKGPISQCDYCLGNNSGVPDRTIDSFYDVSYGDSSVDFFLPAYSQGDCALVLFIHGGAWISGDKSEFTSWAYDACSKYGIAAASVSYPYAAYNSVDGWKILNCIADAVAKIKQVAADRGINITKMMTAGHSAGGHLSLMYAYYMKDKSPVEPVCVLDMSGPTMLYNAFYYQNDGLVTAISLVTGVYFTAETAAYAYEVIAKMSPVSYVNSSTVPTIIAHGCYDIIVPYSDGSGLNDYLNNAGVEHTFITFPNSSHGLENDPDCRAQMMSEYDRYVRKYLLPNGVPTVVHHYETEEIQGTSCAYPSYTLHTCKE